MATTSEQHLKAHIGTASNFWLHSSHTGFDLSRPSTNVSSPTPKLTVQTTTSPITLDPSKSALVIIDMQNFFLSPALGRSPSSPGHQACKQLAAHAIPAARKAGLRVVWVNWGLTLSEVDEMPAGVKRAFGFYSVPATSGSGEDVVAGGVVEGGVGVDKHGIAGGEAGYKGLGSAMGSISLSAAEGQGEVDGGALLMRGSWNADLYPPLKALWDEGKNLPSKPDVWIHKNRMSGLWGARTDLQDFLEKEGITTCLVAGVNTDQCVGGTLTDAFSKGFDCVLLSDGCGTSSPAFAQECWEYNAAHTFGFCCSCEDLAKGVEKMQA